MSKWYGVIGYAETVETAPGVSREVITERFYYGEVTRNHRRLQDTQHLNDSINIANVLTIVADPYAEQHFHSMRYAEFMGVKWKITDVEVQRPRLQLNLGGLYTNG